MLRPNLEGSPQTVGNYHQGPPERSCRVAWILTISFKLTSYSDLTLTVENEARVALSQKTGCGFNRTTLKERSSAPAPHLLLLERSSAIDPSHFRDMQPRAHSTGNDLHGAPYRCCGTASFASRKCSFRASVGNVMTPRTENSLTPGQPPSLMRGHMSVPTPQASHCNMI